MSRVRKRHSAENVIVFVPFNGNWRIGIVKGVGKPQNTEVVKDLIGNAGVAQENNNMKAKHVWKFEHKTPENTYNIVFYCVLGRNVNAE